MSDEFERGHSNSSPRTRNRGGENAEVPPEKIVWINGFPAPPVQPLRPAHALKSVWRLMRNKEDTRQVFEVVEALAGSSNNELFRRWTQTPYAKRVVKDKIQLEQLLGNREWLRKFPQGTVAAAYLEFMEGENLTPDGILDAAAEAGLKLTDDRQFGEYNRLLLHLDVSHDLWHVLTGYGRDALGELCNLAFTRQQVRNEGLRLIVWVGVLVQKIEQPREKIIAAINEAREIACKSNWLLACDVEEILVMPLDAARAHLELSEPVIYNSISEEVKQSLLKPRTKKTQAERESTMNISAGAS